MEKSITVAEAVSSLYPLHSSQCCPVMRTAGGLSSNDEGLQLSSLKKKQFSSRAPPRSRTSKLQQRWLGRGRWWWWWWWWWWVDWAHASSASPLSRWGKILVFSKGTDRSQRTAAACYHSSGSLTSPPSFWGRKDGVEGGNGQCFCDMDFISLHIQDYRGSDLLLLYFLIGTK